MNRRKRLKLKREVMDQEERMIKNGWNKNKK